MANNDVVFIASCNIDLISYVDEMPQLGETIRGNRFEMGFGGKGANKAVACSKLGSKCAIVSKFGDDMFGKNYISYLKESASIDTSNVFVTGEAATGVAQITVDKRGNNAIIVVLGANLLLSCEDVKACESLIKSSKILCTNLEIPFEIALFSLKLAKKHNVITILNFAPAVENCGDELFDYVDYIILNEVEMKQFYVTLDIDDLEEIKKACFSLINKHEKLLGCIVTLGGKGVVFADKKTNGSYHVPGVKVNVVDTTGAGDAFVGSFAHYLNNLGAESILKVVELASEYASLTVQYKGTQSSYISLDQLDKKFKINK